MPRTPLQFQQMKDERKLSLLEHALPLFAVRGKDTVTIDMICQKAKCSHGLAYHYFKNTDQIYQELISSSSYKNLFLDLNKINLDNDAYSEILNLVTKLVGITKKSKVEIALASLIISSDDKKSLFVTLNKLILKGQKEGTVTGGNPSDIASTFFFFLKGMYQTLLNEKHPDLKVPSIDNIMRIFAR